MARTRFRAEVLTPEGQQFAEDVEMVSTQTEVGSIGLLAGHEPLLARLVPAELRLYRSDDEIVRFAQAEGYVQMSAERALILVEDAIPVERLNAAELQATATAARNALDAAPADSDEHARAAHDLRQAEAFLRIAGGEHQ
jgi:F-type H+-transporting ATPase subunit epsilon